MKDELNKKENVLFNFERPFYTEFTVSLSYK